MKRLLLILSLIVLTTAGSFAQKINFGPKIGYAASKISTDIPDVKESAKHNFMVGIFLRFGNKLYIQPEIMYHTSGGTLDSAGLKQEIKFKNLDVPLMIGIKPMNLKVFNLRLMGGPVASFVMDKQIKFNDLIHDPLQAADFKNVIWRIDVGVGVDILFLTLDVRYEFGISNIYKPEQGATSYNMKNDVFTIGLGFKLL